MSTKDAYREKLQHQMDEWKDEMKIFKDKLGKLKGDAKIKANEELEDLQERQKLASTKLKDLKEAGDTAWEKAKTELELAWEEIKHKVKSIKRHFD